MAIHRCALLLAVCLALPFGCVTSRDKNRASGDNGSSPTAGVVASNNRFAADIYAKLAENEGSFLFSPLSLSTALGMVYVGATHQTAQEMADTLQFDQPKKELLTGTAVLLQQLQSDSPDHVMKVINTLWIDQNTVVEPNFLATTDRYYGATPRRADFRKNAKAATDEINRAITEQTKGKIKDLIPDGAIHKLTRLVLTNAVYFKAKWKNPFPEETTEKDEFLVAPGTERNLDFMQRIDSYRYFRSGGIKGIEIPYVGETTSLVILLPTRRGDTARLNSVVQGERLQRFLSRLYDSDAERVDLRVPRFKVESAVRLSETLETLGMKLAFSKQAQFFDMVNPGAQTRRWIAA